MLLERSQVATPSLQDIVIVNDSANINGGSSQVALSSAVALAKAGHRVTLFAAVEPIMPELLGTKNLRFVSTEQHEIVADPSRLRAASQGIWNFKAARMLDTILRDLDPARSVVHFHGWTKALSASVLKATIARKFRAVITLHEFFTTCPIGSFYNHQRKQICSLEPLSASCISENCDPRSYRDKVWRVGRQAVQRYVASVPGSVKHFITLSELSESILRRRLPKAAHFYRVSNPIDLVAAPRAPVGTNTDFTYVGRLSPEKGAVLFARAARASDVSAVFVGDGESASDVRLANADAHITGWIGRAEVRARLAQSRALVFPSLWHEVAPLVISEAAALGVPAIVADSSAAREQVVNGLSGLHFRGADETSLALALHELKNDSRVEMLGSEAFRCYWRAPRLMERHLTELSDVYAKMLAEPA